MTSVLKRYLKTRFPRMALQVRASRKVRLGRPSDLAFSAMAGDATSTVDLLIPRVVISAQATTGCRLVPRPCHA
jgi:hypothetical protein